MFSIVNYRFHCTFTHKKGNGILLMAWDEISKPKNLFFWQWQTNAQSQTQKVFIKNLLAIHPAPSKGNVGNVLFFLKGFQTRKEGQSWCKRNTHYFRSLIKGFTVLLPTNKGMAFCWWLRWIIKTEDICSKVCQTLKVKCWKSNAESLH